MKSLKVLLVMLVLALALTACRSVPSEVMVQHGISLQASDDALEVAQQTLAAVEAQSALLDDELVNASFVKWTEHMESVMAARSVVQKYLIDSKADLNVTSPYNVGNKLLIDMHINFNTINKHWENMIEDAMTAPRDEFIRRFRLDIERFKVLERKFSEWISQFRVKG